MARPSCYSPLPIDRYTERFDVDSPTRALEDVHEARASSVDELVAGTRPLRGQCGVAAAVDGRIVGVDLFDAPGTLVAYWPSLVAGYALDADVVPRSKPPRRRHVRRLLGSVAACRATAADGRLFLASGDTSATAALLGQHVIHLAVSA